MLSSPSKKLTSVLEHFVFVVDVHGPVETVCVGVRRALQTAQLLLEIVKLIQDGQDVSKSLSSAVSAPEQDVLPSEDARVYRVSLQTGQVLEVILLEALQKKWMQLRYIIKGPVLN